MKFRSRLASVFFLCTFWWLGVVQASIPTPPDMDPVLSEPQPRPEIENEENTLNKTFSNKVDFDYAELGTPEPLHVAEISSNDSSTPQSDISLEDVKAAGKKAENGGYTDAEVAEMINNPLGSLWLLFIQNDYIAYDGDFVKNRIGQNTTLIQPVMPFQLTDNVKLIFRPVIPINSFETVDSIVPNGPIGSAPDRNDFDVGLQRETGLGDIVLWTAFATNEMAAPPNIFGAGITTMLDTASEKELGTGQNSMGPMALAVHVDDSWIYGTVVQHWWTVDGDKDRDDVSLTDIQYIGRYRYSKNTNIGFSPNIRYNWKAEASDRWTIPIGIGIDTMIKMGPLPVKVGMELYHYIKKPDKFGPDWQIRFFFVPVVPSPKWSHKALF